MKSFLGAAVALSFAVAGQAHALTAFSIGAVGGKDPGLRYGQSVVVSFDSPNAAGIKETIGGVSGAVGLFRGTHPGVAAAPVGDTSLYQAISTGGSVTFNFRHYAPGVSVLSLYVGSIDSYNTFSITTSKGTSYFDGSDFLTHNGDQTSKLTNRRVYFLFAPTEKFKSITLGSTGVAFEYDDIAVESYQGPHARAPSMPVEDGVEALNPSSATPEPASWALLLTGFGLLGAGARRRRGARTA